MRTISLLKEDKGYILPLTIFIILVFMLYITGMFTVGTANVRQTSWDKNRTEAFYLAESGVNDALFKIIEKKEIPTEKDYYNDDAPSYTSSSTSYTFGSGQKFEVWVKKTDTGYRITSKGTSNGRVRILEQGATSSGGGTPIFPQRVIETKYARPYYNSNYSYDAVLVPNFPGLPANNSNDNLNLNSNENKTLSNNSSYLYSNMNLNSNSNLTINGPVTINTKTLSLSSNTELLINNTTSTPTVFYIENINVNSNSKITVNGPVIFYIKNSMNISSNAEILLKGKAIFYIGGGLTFNSNAVITAHGETEMYINGDIMFDSNSAVNNYDSMKMYIKGKGTWNSNAVIGLKPEKFLMYFDTSITTAQLIANANSELNFCLVAPTRYITFNSNSQLYAVIGYEISFDGGIDKHIGKLVPKNLSSITTSGSSGQTSIGEMRIVN